MPVQPKRQTGKANSHTNNDIEWGRRAYCCRILASDVGGSRCIWAALLESSIYDAVLAIGRLLLVDLVWLPAKEREGGLRGGGKGTTS